MSRFSRINSCCTTEVTVRSSAHAAQLYSFNLKNARNEESKSKILKWRSLRPLALKNKIVWWFEVLKNLEDLCGKSRTSLSINIFHRYLLNSNCHLNWLFKTVPVAFCNVTCPASKGLFVGYDRREKLNLFETWGERCRLQLLNCKRRKILQVKIELRVFILITYTEQLSFLYGWSRRKAF